MAKTLIEEAKALDGMVDLYRAGRSLEEIGHRFGMSRQAVQQKLIIVGEPRRSIGPRKARSLPIDWGES